MTVGEMSSTSIDNCIRYSNPDCHELGMAFSFHHLKVDYPGGDKWGLMEPDIAALRHVFASWQEGMTDGGGWNALFWSNHDQPRPNSRFGDDSTHESWLLSSKLLALCTHLLRGTPYIYQGEELGMTNMHFPDISDYRDIDTLNAYREMTALRGMSHEDMMARIHRHSRDNARTPMQWTAGPNAGFTTGTPWLGVNPNHTVINAAAQVDDPDSVFSHYRNLINLRRELDVITHGDYELLLPDHPALFAYERRWQGQVLTVICSFSDQAFTAPEILPLCRGELLMSNYSVPENAAFLCPYEARIYLK
jgi:trehalose-6-phosphate hydrolase